MNSQKKSDFILKEKFNIVKQVLSKAKAVSEICDEYCINPNLYYRWQGEFLEADEKKSLGSTKAADDPEKAGMEAESQRMKDAIAEIIAENIALKKKNMEKSLEGINPKEEHESD